MPSNSQPMDLVSPSTLPSFPGDDDNSILVQLRKDEEDLKKLVEEAGGPKV